MVFGALIVSEFIFEFLQQLPLMRRQMFGQLDNEFYIKISVLPGLAIDWHAFTFKPDYFSIDSSFFQGDIDLSGECIYFLLAPKQCGEKIHRCLHMEIVASPFVGMMILHFDIEVQVAGFT